MSESDLIELGFKPNLDENGEKISYHPEGVTYYLHNGEFSISTTSLYPYLWIQRKNGFQKLITTKIDKNLVAEAMAVKSMSDLKLLEEKYYN